MFFFRFFWTNLNSKNVYIWWPKTKCIYPNIPKTSPPSDEKVSYFYQGGLHPEIRVYICFYKKCSLILQGGGACIQGAGFGIFGCRAYFWPKQDPNIYILKNKKIIPQQAVWKCVYWTICICPPPLPQKKKHNNASPKLAFSFGENAPNNTLPVLNKCNFFVPTNN